MISLNAQLHILAVLQDTALILSKLQYSTEKYIKIEINIIEMHKMETFTGHLKQTSDPTVVHYIWLP